MNVEQVHYLSDKEEELVSLLFKIGIGSNIAKILVFLANIEEATSRDLERGLDLCTSEVSIAMSELLERGWVTVRVDFPGVPSGRKTRFYRLSKSFGKIITEIEHGKKEEAKKKLARIQKLRDYFE